jgi:hypothetical protein
VCPSCGPAAVLPARLGRETGEKSREACFLRRATQCRRIHHHHHHHHYHRIVGSKCVLLAPFTPRHSSPQPAFLPLATSARLASTPLASGRLNPAPSLPPASNPPGARSRDVAARSQEPGARCQVQVQATGARRQAQATGARRQVPGKATSKKRSCLCTAGWTLVVEHWKIEAAVFLPLPHHHHHHHHHHSTLRLAPRSFCFPPSYHILLSPFPCFPYSLSSPASPPPSLPSAPPLSSIFPRSSQLIILNCFRNWQHRSHIGSIFSIFCCLRYAVPHLQ